jgi:hypothetical protein
MSVHTQKLNFFKRFLKKFSKDLENTQSQSQNPNTQKIENPNPDLLVLLGAYV